VKGEWREGDEERERERVRITFLGTDRRTDSSLSNDLLINTLQAHHTVNIEDCLGLYADKQCDDMQVLQSSTVLYSTMQDNTIQYITIQHSAVQSLPVQCSTVQHSRIQKNAARNALRCRTQYCPAQCSTVRYYIAISSLGFTDSPEPQSYEGHDSDLGGEGLGGGYSMLPTCIQIHT
jgi:hypothetical protein